MHADPVVTTTIFFGLFFTLISLLQFLSQKISFPYTVSLLIVGLIAQYTSKVLDLESYVNLSTSVTFFILLPLLLFDSAMRINFHQFRLHARTLSFLTTFGLLVSIAVVGGLMALLLGIPFGYGLLFGAIISSTDPISVVSLFKSIRAPKRLAMLIEGESMFNDATAVIVFRMISGIVVSSSVLESTDVILNVGNFFYVAIGSIIFGSLAGYISTRLINYIDNDHIVETTITVALAISVFIISEHFLHLSGVISTVMAGIIVGNIGRATISRGVIHFIDNLWEYVSFLAISLVFFFATFTLDISFFFRNTWQLLIVIFVTLIGRAVSVYLTFFISNRVSFFGREPNVPMKWQHIMNWGGLRGVIPLVLVYSIPDSFEFKTDLVSFTLATFLFTLFVNGITIKTLLVQLGIHLPRKEEQIIEEEKHLFEIENAKQKLKNLPRDEFDDELRKKLQKKLEHEEQAHKVKLIRHSTTAEFLRSLKYQALQIERNKLDNLFSENFINEAVYFTFETQLDLQLDALEYPEVNTGRGFKSGGIFPSQKNFKSRIARLQHLSENYPLLARVADVPLETLIKNRLALLNTRIVATDAVLEYLIRIEGLFSNNKRASSAIRLIESEYKFYLDKNKKQVDDIKKQYPKLSKEHQKEYLYSFIKH